MKMTILTAAYIGRRKPVERDCFGKEALYSANGLTARFSGKGSITTEDWTQALAYRDPAHLNLGRSKQAQV
jgi:hypothetical protein